MSIDLEELKHQFPLCLFENKHDLYIAIFACGFIDIVSINWLQSSQFLSTTQVDPVDTYNYDKLKHIYDTNEYVMDFLKANGFTLSNAGFGSIRHKKLGFIVYVAHLNYRISINDIHYNADSLIEMIKKELDIQTVYKPVLEY